MPGYVTGEPPQRRLLLPRSGRLIESLATRDLDTRVSLDRENREGRETAGTINFRGGGCANRRVFDVAQEMAKVARDRAWIPSDRHRQGSKDHPEYR
jgi:hypothetical protein